MLWADVFVCRHEYTLGNLMFAVTVDAANQQLQQRLKTVQQLRAEGKPTIPSSMALELDTNPFLRVRPSTVCIATFMPAQPEHPRIHAMSYSRPLIARAAYTPHVAVICAPMLCRCKPKL